MSRNRRARLRTLVGALLVGFVGLLLPVALASEARAATSGDVIVDADGAFLAKAEFNSGLHYYHVNWRPGPGVNSFQILDACDDGWTPVLLWDEGTTTKKLTLSDECTTFLPWRYHEVKPGYAPEQIEEMGWYLYLQNANGDTVGNEFKSDWWGSYSYQPDSTYFTHSSVYMEELNGQDSVTASLTWKPAAMATDGDEQADSITAVLWDELQRRTPLPPSLTEDRRTSMYKQMWCHVRYAWITELPFVDGGGPTWDVESGRPDIPWDQVKNVTDHKCNWGGTGGGGGGHGYIPPTDGGEEPANLAPIADAGPDRSGAEGAAVRLGGTVWDDGGQATARWSYEPLDGVDAGATCSFADASAAGTTVSCTDDGRYRVTLTADDGANRPIGDSAVVTLGNVAPTLSLGGAEAWSVHHVGDTVDLGASFTDPGANDTHTCEVTWDDGTTETYAATASGCDRGHTFDAAGMYTMKVKVTDDDGGSDTAEVMVVVYDPDAGFVTGGGSAEPETATLTPAAMAVPADALAKGGAGTAKFTFNPQYLPGDEGPAATGGKVAYRLGGADFDLQSDTVDWLVVTPDGKTAFRGTGTLNGESGYGFVAYATADPEAFRIVVWDLDASPHPDGEPLYDTARGAGYDVDVASPAPIANGAIRLHRS
ncbi:PKD domain-containing protein [Streptomyces sp. NPDC051940]|uniref:PKD domain-containing protein n=1 Tax=Streptomyces sp. NPDC051940 TaxID=3155675 RepID=UPI00341E6BFB